MVALHKNEVYDHCEYCNSEYVVRREWQRFCCAACRSAHHYYSNREQKIVYMRDYRAQKRADKEAQKNLSESVERDERQNTGSTDAITVILEELIALRQEVAMLRGGVASADASPSVSATRERGTAPKALDDIDFDIKQATANADNNSTWNFMIASALQVVGHCRDLPPDVVEYGLRTKRIPPDKAPRPQPRKANGDIKAMDGAEREFAAPAFDDDELDLLGI